MGHNVAWVFHLHDNEALRCACEWAVNESQDNFPLPLLYAETVFSKRATMIYSPRAFLLLARKLFDVTLDDCGFRAHLSCSLDNCSILWETIEGCPGMMTKHLIWALYFLKTYNTEDTLATQFGTTRKTYHHWIWTVLLSIAKLHQSRVSFNNLQWINSIINTHNLTDLLAES